MESTNKATPGEVWLAAVRAVNGLTESLKLEEMFGLPLDPFSVEALRLARQTVEEFKEAARAEFKARKANQPTPPPTADVVVSAGKLAVSVEALSQSGFPAAQGGAAAGAGGGGTILATNPRPTEAEEERMREKEREEWEAYWRHLVAVEELEIEAGMRPTPTYYRTQVVSEPDNAPNP